MRKIFFDVSTLNPEKITGVGVYMLQLLRQFAENPDLDVIPVVKLSRYKKIKAIAELVPQKNCKILFPWKLSTAPESLYHGPDFKLNTWGPLPRLVTIHDMVVFEQKYNEPEFYLRGMREMTKVLTSRNLEAVIVNSHFTQAQVLRFFPALAEKIHVTYLGCDREIGVGGGARLNLPAKYVLFLGTLEKRKNIVNVIKAFEIFKQKNPSHSLILVGNWGFGKEEIQKALENSPVKADIQHLPNVKNDSIAELYQRAEVFFFPSLYEGFGLPVLEAMSLGCPVVTSEGGALEEICGKAALLAPAENPAALAEQLHRVVTDSALQASLKAQGLLQSQKFTWKKCAQETAAIYRKYAVPI